MDRRGALLLPISKVETFCKLVILVEGMIEKQLGFLLVSFRLY